MTARGVTTGLGTGTEREDGCVKSLKHFLVLTSTVGVTTTYTARCGYTSTDRKYFVDPRGYKVERVLACCQTKKVRVQNDE